MRFEDPTPEERRRALDRAWRKMETAQRQYLNAPVRERHARRKALVAAMERYERLRTGRMETLQERRRRLTR